VNTIPWTCWYPKTHYGMMEMVEASNSLWKERRRWRVDGEDNYDGQSQCTATRNVIEGVLADAIVIPLVSTGEPNPSICNQRDHRSLQKRLQNAYDRGYKSLPILFFRETEGMIKVSDCRQMWGDKDCYDGYQKEFFSQEYMFENGACIYRPPNCREAYYFPPEDANRREAGCSAHSESGFKRMVMLRALEKRKPAMDLTDLTVRCDSDTPVSSASLRHEFTIVGAPPVPHFNLQVTAMVVVVFLIILTSATRKGARRGPRRRLVMTPPRRVSPAGTSDALLLDPAKSTCGWRNTRSSSDPPRSC
jgi:hypothetical protein